MKKQYKTKKVKAADGDQLQPFTPTNNFQSQWDVNQPPPNLPGSPSYLEPLTYTQPKKKKQWWEQPEQDPTAPMQPQQLPQPNQGLPNPSTGLSSQFKTEDYDQTGYKAPDEFSPITPGPKKSLRNTQMGINAGLALVNNLIPEQPIKSNKAPRQGQVQTAPLQYGAPLNNNQGIGQTAISKNGSTIKPYANKGLIVENDAYKMLSPSTAELGGNYHKNNGTDLSFYGNNVEAEKGEPIAINDENNLVIFGNRKPKENPLIKQEVKNLGFNPNSKYKSLVKEIGTQEGKQQKLMNKASSLLENNSPQDKWEQLSFNSGKAMLIGSNQELENLNMKKNSLGKLQEIQNAFFPDKKAKNGKTVYAVDGDTLPTIKKEDYDYLQGLYNKAQKQKKGDDVLNFQKEYHRLAPDYAKSVIQSEPLTNYGKNKKFTTSDLTSNEDSLFGKRTERYFAALNRPTDRGEIVSNPKDLKPGMVNKDLGPLQPLITDSYTPAKKEEINTFNFDSTYKKKPFEKGKYDWLNDTGEIQALTYNPQAVNYSTVQPHLDQPYNVSFQDRRNQVQSNLRASNQAIGDNPAAQATLMGQANEQLQPINADEFRTNQAIYSGVLGSNNQKLDAAAAYNASKYDTMSENAAANRFNKFATTKAALQSMGQKRLQFDQGQNELEAFNNMLPNYNINPQENNVDFSGADPRVLQSIFGNYTPSQTIQKTVSKTDSKGNNSQTTTSVPKKTKFGKDGTTMSHSRMMKLL